MYRVLFVNDSLPSPIPVAILEFRPSRDLYRSICTEYCNDRSYREGMFSLELSHQTLGSSTIRLNYYDLSFSLRPVLSFNVLDDESN